MLARVLKAQALLPTLCPHRGWACILSTVGGAGRCAKLPYSSRRTQVERGGGEAVLQFGAAPQGWKCGAVTCAVPAGRGVQGVRPLAGHGAPIPWQFLLPQGPFSLRRPDLGVVTPPCRGSPSHRDGVRVAAGTVVLQGAGLGSPQQPLLAEGGSAALC